MDPLFQRSETSVCTDAYAAGGAFSISSAFIFMYQRVFCNFLVHIGQYGSLCVVGHALPQVINNISVLLSCI